MDIVAIIAIRNESAYIGRKIRHLVDNEVEVVIIDNASKDNSVEICLDHGVPPKNIYQIPYHGTFELQRQLKKKEEIIERLNCDWIIHTDADEIIEAPDDQTLKESILKIDQQGYDVINCDEFVFVPHNENVNYSGSDYVSEMKYYYFYQPRSHRLMRIFKKSIGASNIPYAGHNFPIDYINVAPTSFILRHYIGLSLAYIKRKYGNRVYSEKELKKRWHNSRQYSWDNLKSPPNEKLSILENGIFDRSNPMKSHFWYW